MNSNTYLGYMYSYPHKTAYREFSPPVQIAPYLHEMKGREGGLYFHIPFCKHKCGFCNLFSCTQHGKNLINQYLRTMQCQTEQLLTLTEGLLFSSFTIGGGTPLVLNEEQIDQLWKIVNMFGVDPVNIDVSIETSPEFTDLSLLRHLKNNGVNRLSIGIQSFHDLELKKIGRAINSSLCRQALENISEVNFPNLNIDLIYGIEGQTIESFNQSISDALSYEPSELFLYPLYVREGTNVKNRAEDNDYLLMYEFARDRLTECGFIQTSMRRFVKEKVCDFEFSCGDELMISCGCGGRSYIGDLHFSDFYSINPKQVRQIIDNYIQRTDFTTVSNGYLLNKDEKTRRFIIKNLMYYNGIDKMEFIRRFGVELSFDIFGYLKDEGFIVENSDFIRLTTKGMAYSDYIGQLFISDEVRNKMKV